MTYQLSLLVSGPGEGTSSGEAPQGPRKKRARVDPTVESVRKVLVLYKYILIGNPVVPHESIHNRFYALNSFNSRHFTYKAGKNMKYFDRHASVF